MAINKNVSDIELYREALASYLEVDYVYLFWKARVGLYGLLKSIGITKGDEVILPAYTCVVVPNAILYLGARPIYVDIDKKTYNAKATNIETAITSKTKVIICQNTYGLSTDTDKIHKIAKQKGIYTIEDCTHGFGGYYNDIKNGLTCDAAIFSTQWNKPFSTGVGGFAICNNPTLKRKFKDYEKNLITPSTKNTAILSTLLLARNHLVIGSTYWLLLKIYRWLSYKGLVVGSSNSMEINSTRIPPDYLLGFTNTQSRQGLKNLNKLSNSITRRTKIAQKYTSFLKENNKNNVSENLFHNHSFLKYPLLVKNRQQFFLNAEKDKIQLGDWFVSPLHPVEKDLHNWEFQPNKYPIAQEIAAAVINLPTDIDSKELKRVLNFLSNNINKIVPAATD